MVVENKVVFTEEHYRQLESLIEKLFQKSTDSIGAIEVIKIEPLDSKNEYNISFSYDKFKNGKTIAGGYTNMYCTFELDGKCGRIVNFKDQYGEHPYSKWDF